MLSFPPRLTSPFARTKRHYRLASAHLTPPLHNLHTPALRPTGPFISPLFFPSLMHARFQNFIYLFIYLYIICFIHRKIGSTSSTTFWGVVGARDAPRPAGMTPHHTPSLCMLLLRPRERDTPCSGRFLFSAAPPALPLLFGRPSLCVCAHCAACTSHQQPALLFFFFCLRTCVAAAPGPWPGKCPFLLRPPSGGARPSSWLLD